MQKSECFIYRLYRTIIAALRFMSITTIVDAEGNANMGDPVNSKILNSDLNRHYSASDDVLLTAFS
jgi:hypothetical protein